MSKALSIMNALREINSLEDKMALAENKPQIKGKIQAKIDEQRALVPKPILSHHDRVRAKGRHSVAKVSHWVCKGCNLSISRSMHGKLRVVSDLVVCENCGSYLFLDDEESLVLAAK